MAAPRLPFLWPFLYRTAEAQTPAAVRVARAAARRQRLHLTTRPQQRETASQRYGTANEPQPPPTLGGGKGVAPATQEAKGEQPKLPKTGEKLPKDGEEEVKTEARGKEKSEHEKRTDPTTVDGASPVSIRNDPMFAPSSSGGGGGDQTTSASLRDGAVESLLKDIPGPTPSPVDISATSGPEDPRPPEDHPDKTFDEHTPPVKAPHIEAPPYVHHFDTYGLVRRLEEAGWSDEHAITAMKAVRLMLADNMDLANQALVSKSMVENELYLFRAACAELKTEVTTRRRAEQEKMRTERNQLQHEVEILSQRLGQEAAALKDELKGMFDDRKMAVRNEQRSMESKIQELNYKITVNLQADARSEVEGLRMVMTRRVIITLGVLVIMIIGSLRLYSSALHEAEMEKKRMASRRSGGTQTEASGHASTGSGPGDAGEGMRMDRRGEMVVKEGDNPAFVSLG